ncbi:hypothetical protein OHAE_5020 [Ochrobactrum soli]|uniref:Uncharacterized protein n=1 Tax=Ochrobactrum soli TaxID=2448455 RepID=A0A2P9HDR2_9HYPH|nr:hypothetical protein OHAE_5020 [[Ochrobactrum] soli]
MSCFVVQKAKVIGAKSIRPMNNFIKYQCEIGIGYALR